MDTDDEDVARRWAHEVCLELPRATTDQPFGEGADAFRVGGRLFGLLMSPRSVGPHRLLNVKADPLEVPLLIGTYPWILPGYHMSKKHWVSLELGPGADLTLAAELVADSYDVVVSLLPPAVRADLSLRTRTT